MCVPAKPYRDKLYCARSQTLQSEQDRCAVSEAETRLRVVAADADEQAVDHPPHRHHRRVDARDHLRKRIVGRLRAYGLDHSSVRISEVWLGTRR